jgi:hypothetical protein
MSHNKKVRRMPMLQEMLRFLPQGLPVSFVIAGGILLSIVILCLGGITFLTEVVLPKEN